MLAIIIQPSTQAAGTLQAEALVYDSKWGENTPNPPAAMSKQAYNHQTPL